MMICYFGMYSADYTRNRILIKGLRENGVGIIECNERRHLLWGLRYYYLLKNYFGNGCQKADVIFVGFPGQTDVPIAWVLAKLFRKRLIFDAFISIYNTQVYDRKYVAENSFKAKLFFFIDWLSCLLADRVILDTNTHIDYFVKTFGIPREKFLRVFVGTDTNVIRPMPMKTHKNFVVGFHGYYLPLQGVPIILEAAKLIKDKSIVFHLLGSGVEYAKCRDLADSLHLNNTEFFGKIPYEELAGFISNADIYLGGHFSNSLKAGLVIPNKVFEAIAAGKPVIVGESVAMKELFKHGVNCWMVKRGDPQSLTKAITYLKKNPIIRENIAKSGYKLLRSQLSAKKVAHELLALLQ